MKSHLLSKTALLFVVLTTAAACKKEQECPTETVTYASQAKAIINARCATANCHNGTYSPNMTTYAGVKTAIDNGSFANRVFTVKDMPQGTPLSDEDMQTLKCWQEDGFPQ